MKRYRGRGRQQTRACSNGYELHRSPFYRLERPKDLANLLRLGLDDLKRMIAQKGELYSLREEKTGTKTRQLAVPVKELRRCHDRVFSLLKRIKLPDYIMCPRSGSSPVDNALRHVDGRWIATVDIKAFYPSTTEHHVFVFFRRDMQMSSECARLMASICTFQGALPLGSPMSPHLACLTHLDVFAPAASLARSLGFQSSVWVDDVTFSGSHERRDLLNLVRKAAAKKGLQVHKLKMVNSEDGAEITGTFVRAGKVYAANSSHLRIRDLMLESETEKDPRAQFLLLNRLIAMTRHQKTILRKGGSDIDRLNKRIAFYKREMKRLEAIISVTEPTVKPEVTQNGDLPF